MTEHSLAVFHPTCPPDVSVIVRIRDTADTLPACLESLTAQTMPSDRFEILAVDDGSRDDSGHIAETMLQARSPAGKVLSHPAHLSPASTGNIGLDQARGRYVLFLCGDDRLAPRALEELTAAADQYESDMVFGKLADHTGRKPPGSMFKRTEPHVDLAASRVYLTLTPERLIRRSFLERVGLRFDETAPARSVDLFTAAATLQAEGLTVLADREYVSRGDPRNRIDRQRPTSRQLLDSTARLMQTVIDSTSPGALRNLALARHFEIELAHDTGQRLLGNKDAADRQRTWEHAQVLVRTYLTADVQRLLPVALVVRYALVGLGKFSEAEEVVKFQLNGQVPKQVVEKGRVYQAYPYFRDPTVGLPDICFDSTHLLNLTCSIGRFEWDGPVLGVIGHAFFEELPAEGHEVTHLVFRERSEQIEEQFRCHRSPRARLKNKKGESRAMGGFHVKVDLSQTGDGYPIPTGRWDVFIRTRYNGINREVPVSIPRLKNTDFIARRPIIVSPAADHEVIAMPYYSSEGLLTVEVSQRLPLPNTPDN
ncbi:glycosyltransferase family 2 protein [Streptomyces fractus]|uniref:glycosyltransferase family 2 protein n=1 Tax=Streptomyces fractus TaxID=641806 RepID=UPI003CED4CB2